MFASKFYNLNPFISGFQKFQIYTNLNSFFSDCLKVWVEVDRRLYNFSPEKKVNLNCVECIRFFWRSILCDVRLKIMHFMYLVCSRINTKNFRDFSFGWKHFIFLLCDITSFVYEISVYKPIHLSGKRFFNQAW